MFWLCHSFALFVIARFLQGLSAAAVWTVGLALLVDTMEAQDIGAAMGYVSMGMSSGFVLGPFLGGIVYASLLSSICSSCYSDTLY